MRALTSRITRSLALAFACAVAAPACVSWQDPGSDVPVCAGYSCSACLAIQGCAFCTGRGVCQRVHTPCTNRAFEPAVAFDDPARCTDGPAADAGTGAD